MTSCTLSYNSVSSDIGYNSHGGALLFWNYASGTLSDCYIHSNRGERGGGVAVWDSWATLTACILKDNSAEDYGGGTWLYDTYATLTACTFAANTVGQYGGGASISYGRTTIKSCRFDANEVFGFDGGAVDVFIPDTFDTSFCLFVSNSAFRSAGAISGTGAQLSDCTFEANSAKYGGALGVFSGTCERCHLSSNSAAYGGAVDSNGATTLLECTITNCTATKRGSGVYSAAEMTVSDSLVHGFADDISMVVPSIFYHATDSSDLFLNTVTFRNNTLAAVSSEGGANIAIRNCIGLAPTDVNASFLLGCSDAGKYCPIEYCNDGVVAGFEVCASSPCLFPDHLITGAPPQCNTQP